MNERKPTRPEQDRPDKNPRIYVASLSDYNAGILHGRWIEATDDVEAMQDEIDVVLAESPTMARYGDVAEEWCCRSRCLHMSRLWSVRLVRHRCLRVLHDIFVEDGGVKFGEHGIGCFVVSEDVAAVTVSAPK